MEVGVSASETQRMSGTWIWMIPGSPSGFQLSNSPFRLPTWRLPLLMPNRGVTML